MAQRNVLPEIEQLFRDLVENRWRGPGRAQSDQRFFEVQLPAPMNRHRGVQVAVFNRTLHVVVESGTGADRERVERDFALPPNGDVDTVEAHFEGAILRVRVTMRRGPG